MAKKSRPRKKTGEKQKTVQVDVEVYRSLILDRLRAEIQAKRVALEKATIAGVGDLKDMAYYKMPYYKMKYYKMKDDRVIGQEVINPSPVIPQTRGRKGQK